METPNPELQDRDRPLKASAAGVRSRIAELRAASRRLGRIDDSQSSGWPSANTPVDHHAGRPTRSPRPISPSFGCPTCPPGRSPSRRWTTRPESAIPRSLRRDLAGSSWGEVETPEGALGGLRPSASPAAAPAGSSSRSQGSPRVSRFQTPPPLATRPSVFPLRGAVGDLYQSTVASEFQWMKLGNSQVNGVEITTGGLVSRNTVVPVGADGHLGDGTGQQSAERPTSHRAPGGGKSAETAGARSGCPGHLASPGWEGSRVVRDDKVGQSGMVWLTRGDGQV